MAAVSPDREIEIRIRERLVVEREVPPLLVGGPKAAADHRGGEQRAVLLRLLAHAPIRRPWFLAEEVERRARIDLAGVRAPHQREIDARAARGTAAVGNVALL